MYMRYKKSNNQFPFLFFVIALVAVSSGAVLRAQSNNQKPNVLGVMQLLAKGDDSGSSGGGDDREGSSGGGGSSNSGSSGGSSGSSGKSEDHGSSSAGNSGSGSPANVSFTVIPTPKPTSPPKIEKPETEQETETKPTAEVKAPEKTEPETEQELEHVNKELEAEDVHVGTSAGGFTVKHGEIEAETHFPLSVDASTHTLTVTTPAGVKTVTVLPDQAVTNMLRTGIFDHVATSTGEQKIELTEAGNQPAFAIPGIEDKKFLGIVPVTIAKTAIVSAQNGGIIRTDETLFNRILDALSQ